MSVTRRYPSRMHDDLGPDLHSWLRGALGQRVYTLERKIVAEALAQVFGWQLLQIGLWGDDDGLLALGDLLLEVVHLALEDVELHIALAFDCQRYVGLCGFRL